MTSFYNKTAKQLLVDLINEGNPEMPFPVNTTDYDFTNPESITPLPNGHNTQIRVIAKPSAPYTGNVLLTYQRINLGALFRNVTPVVNHWVDTSGKSSHDNLIGLHDLLGKYSKKYGVLLEKDQISEVNLSRQQGQYGNPFNISAETHSLVFIGSTPANWVIGKRTLDDLIEVDDIEGRLYPDGNDFSTEADRRPYLTPLFHQTDFTLYAQENSYYWGRNNNNFSYNDNALYNGEDNIYRGIMDAAFRQAFGFGVVQGFSNRHYTYPPDENGDVYTRGIEHEAITLPDSRHPEANSEFFNSAIVIEIPDDCPWGVGNIYFHYNQ